MCCGVLSRQQSLKKIETAVVESHCETGTVIMLCSEHYAVY